MAYVWSTAGGTTNVLQAAAGGSYPASFSDLSPSIIVTCGVTVTNYLDIGGATNIPARYYRVRLVP